MTATTERGSATQAPQLVTATIDGVSVSVPKGTLVIRAAEQMGVHVPRFCDHPLLDPVGACRQCLVDIATPGPDGTLRPMPKPQPSCAIELTEGMQVQDAGDLAGGREGPARRDGAPAHQPPARLPGVRQGRRVPAAEPGDERRPGPVPLPRRQAHLPQADQDLQPGAARPRAVRAVPALHPLLPGDRGRPVHRPAAPRHPAADRHLLPGRAGHRHPGRADARRVGRAVRVVLLRQHDPDLPGRRAHQRGVPVPLPSVRPGVDPVGVRALRERVRPAHRPPPRLGAAPARRRRPGGERGVELRQGPFRLHLVQRHRPPHHADGARRGRRARGRLVAGRARGGGPRAAGGARGTDRHPGCREPARRPASGCCPEGA